MKKFKDKKGLGIYLIISSIILVVAFFLITTLTKGELPNNIDFGTNNLTGISNSRVTLDDKLADYYYYRGLNYTHFSQNETPSNSLNKYPDKALVNIDILYSGKDINTARTGSVSLTEGQTEFKYLKVLPVEDGHVLIELIDNPFTNRPNDLVFNGWVTNFKGAKITLDRSVYKRYAKVPVEFENGYPKKINITFNASWVPGAISYAGNNFRNAFYNLNNPVLKEIKLAQKVALPFDMTGYFREQNINFYQSCNGMYNDNGEVQTDCWCYSWGGCRYYSLIQNENYNPNNNYYKLDGRMIRVYEEDLPIKYDYNYENGFDENSNPAGFYEENILSYGESFEGYFDSSGNPLQGTCYRTNCSAYFFLDYFDENGKPRKIDPEKKYLYLVTRDTNIIVVTGVISEAWTDNKPFTLTSVHNGRDYGGRINTRRPFYAYNDTRIENLEVYSNYMTSSNSTTPPSSTDSAGVFYVNYHNVKLGRNIKRNRYYTTFRSVLGGNNQRGNGKNNLIIESGLYQDLSLTNGGVSSSNIVNQVETFGVYGSDYDRAIQNNNNLEVYFCASGSWGGEIYPLKDRPLFDLTVKSGSFGTSRYDYTAGIYVGGRSYGNHYGKRMAKIEGGYIYNLIGGPLSARSMENRNDTFIYMTGGVVDSIVGGAGRSATYGNRIIQVTGGRVNYHVFGGSNGYQGSTSEGQVIGDSFVYIGGNSEIGTDNQSSLYGAESGSVFGIGNGREGQSSIGSSNNSNIMIRDKALIKNNVYGGGNFGAAGVAGDERKTTTHILMDGGVVRGSLYGGGNNNGSGSNQVSSTINIAVKGGKIEGSLYGGSNNEGTVYGDVNLDIFGGKFDDSVYGGGKGGYQSARSPGTYVEGNIVVNVGTETSFPEIANNLYGGSAYGTVNATNNTTTPSDKTIKLDVKNINIKGSVFGGSKGSNDFRPIVAGDIFISVSGGTIPNLFGGNDMSGEELKDNYITITGGKITNIYGGGNEVSANNTYLSLKGGESKNIFGGSNESGEVKNAEIKIDGIKSTNIYGGNNLGGKTTNTDIELISGEVLNIYGGGKFAPVTKTTILLTSGTSQNVYGGGEEAIIEEDTNIEIVSGTYQNIFGGSNKSGNVKKANIKVVGGTTSNLHGGGKLADVNKTDIEMESGKVVNLYGGGESADIKEETKVVINGGEVELLFGGSNQSGEVSKTNVSVNKGIIHKVFGGNNKGGITNFDEVTINGGRIEAVFGGGNEADSKNATVLINDTEEEISYVYGGGNAASSEKVNLKVLGGKIKYLFGGANQSGTINSSNISVKNNSQINTLFGSNNAGGETQNAEIEAFGGTFENIFGGGNEAPTGAVNLKLKNVLVKEEVYGGGKDGEVLKSTNSLVSDSKILKNIYSGGKGKTANVFKNTTLRIEGNTEIKGHVFGGGNAAKTGTEVENNSESLVEIAGAIIGKNVYGGANTSVVYGTTRVNVGSISGLDNQKISIGNTIFGGGEANASGSEIYDFSFISVTKGIDINIINSPDNNIDIKGSIFGSGNASSTTGESIIHIKNYGTRREHKKNISLQRATKVVMDNSTMELFGATDRTNEYSNVLFSISRVDKLMLVNNSSIYLENSTNLLKSFDSRVVEDGDHAEVIIKDGSITKNVDNRLYSKEGVNINIATNEAVTQYGEVKGMTFFGMYQRSIDGIAKTAFYNESYNEKDEVLPGEFYAFSSGSYVLGSHMTAHDIEKDGFYSNYENKENEGVIEVKYIEPIPESSNYYMWTLGETVSVYEVDLIASRLSTLGTYELSLINSPDPNTEFSIIGVNYNGLKTGFELVDESEIPRINKDGTANDKMALVVKSGKNGWLTDGKTTMITETNYLTGTTVYKSENSTVVPSLLFNLYHSKNLKEAGDVGTLVINMLAIRPVDDLNNEVKRVNINVNISKQLFNSNEYEGAMTSGEEHEFFVSTQTNITTKSKLSAYFSLFIDDTDNIYKEGYHRSLTSNIVYPANTKLTMIDLKTATPTYYYYIVTPEDVIEKEKELARENEVSYDLSRFIKMGSLSPENNYKDSVHNEIYYDEELRMVSEEFIFQVDFFDSGFDKTLLDNSLLIELRNKEGQSLTGVLGINHENMRYNLLYDRDAKLKVDASLSKDKIYVKDTVNIKVKTNFLQQQYGGNAISDTTYYDKKLGLKLSIFDEENNLLNGASLFGIAFSLDGINYYPRMDGTTRINIADRVANSSSNIKLITSNSNLSTGKYKILIESFGSFDGVYYGPVSSDQKTLKLEILNNIYGLKSKIKDESVTISKEGITMDNTNLIKINLAYDTGVKNPNLRVAFRRRKYEEIFQKEYEVVDLNNYLRHSLRRVNDERYEYLLSEDFSGEMDLEFKLKDKLKTGTYQIVFSLYDGDNYIGEVYNYIVIR